MALPACQQRALDRIEGALRASEPQLASMYAIFGRLNAGEPIGMEQLARKRLRLLQHGTAMYAIVLLPVMEFNLLYRMVLLLPTICIGMSRTTTDTKPAVDREELRRELLKLIVKNEEQRRDQRKAQEK